jgi:hypothetical protein
VNTETANAIAGMFAYNPDEFKDHWAHKVKPGDMLRLRPDHRDVANDDGWVKVVSINPSCVTVRNGYHPAFIGTAFFEMPVAPPI